MKALLLRDLRLAFRSGGGFGLGLAFFLILAILVPLGVGAEALEAASVLRNAPAEEQEAGQRAIAREPQARRWPGPASTW